MNASMTPVVFGPEDRPLFGWVHQPTDRISRGTVVLCPPLAREYISAHYSYRVIAEGLAQAGLTTIRFDYDGTGDSVGDDTDPDRLAAQLSSIRHAIDLAYQLGTSELALVGMRMGALLAAQAAEGCERLQALVLWDPCASGRAYLREQTALFRLRYGAPSAAAGEGEGGKEVPGFVLTPQSVRDLVDAVPPSSLAHVERALVLTRCNAKPVGNYGLESVPTDYEPAIGQAELMDVEPFYSKVPPTTGGIVEWLDQVFPDATRPQRAPESVDVLRTTNRSGIAISERIVTLGPTALFGIETIGPSGSGGPLIVFVNSGNDSHIGPNRLWVDMAREWAGLGCRCVRFDLSGLGDSPVRPGQPAHVVRAPEAFDDMKDVMEALGADAGSDPDAPTVFVGLCSGAYQALESAIDLRPHAVFAINPLLRFQPPEIRDGPLDPRRRLCRPVGNLRSAYRALPSWWILRAARDGYLAISRARSSQRPATYWLEVMSQQGTEVLCVCGEPEAEQFFHDTLPPGEEITVGDRARMEVLSGLDHALIPAAHRSRVTKRLTQFVRELAGGRDPAADHRSGPPARSVALMGSK